MITAKTYKLRVKQQLKFWVSGKSIHNEIDNECCPDFSCCVPSLRSSKSERLKFEKSNKNQRSQLLNGFLKTLIE